MSKVSLEERRQDRMDDLMNKFFEYEKGARDLAGDGGKFVDVHKWQIKAADVIHALDEEGILHLAKEEYPWEVDKINEYLEIYDEIQSGVKL